MSWALTASHNYSPVAADRTARPRGRLQAGRARDHRGPEEPLHGPRSAAARLQPGSEREGGAVPHHRRARRRSVDPGADQPHRGQGLDRAHAHHQHPVALQPAGSLGGDPDAAAGSEQADPPGGAQRAVEDGRPDQHRPGLPAAARPGPRSREPRHRRRGARQGSGHDEVPHRGAEGRERVRAPRRGRSAEPPRHREGHQAPAAGHQGRRLVGAHARRRRARQDRRARASSTPSSS